MKFILSILLITSISISNNGPFVVVLGIAQDGGAPHANCQKFCCKNLWDGINSEKVSSIGVINPKTGEVVDSSNLGIKGIMVDPLILEQNIYMMDINSNLYEFR